MGVIMIDLDLEDVYSDATTSSSRVDPRLPFPPFLFHFIILFLWRKSQWAIPSYKVYVVEAVATGIESCSLGDGGCRS